jgi:hypothetical protein
VTSISNANDAQREWFQSLMHLGFSLRNLGVLCVFAVNLVEAEAHR